jgi:hypothetical protein
VVDKPFKEDRKTTGQLSRQVISQVCNDLSHAGNGTFLHLLINIGGPQASVTALVNLKKKKRKMKKISEKRYSLL